MSTELQRAQPGMPVFTVSQVTRYLKESLEQDSLLADLWISGEVSNLRPASSGHTYFTLKDHESQVRSVMFRGGRGADLLQYGSLVMAHGRVSFYEARGEVQFVANIVMPEGTGPLFLELERLKTALEAEGLFEDSRKRPLPRFPQVVGLVTSPSGAVLDDIRNVLSRRYPLVRVLLAPTLVQGEGAAPGIVSALNDLNQDGRADVIILARGGGSLEELWPFNEEAVARAIYASRIPVVSAVGHERDYTIADDVADKRAPTPSAAAELVVPDGPGLMQDILGHREGLIRAFSHQLTSRGREVDSLALRVRGRSPDIDTLRRRVDDLASSSTNGLTHHLSLWRSRMDGFEKRLQALNPGAILYRGYAIVQKLPDGQVVSRKDQVRDGDALKLTVGDGSLAATAGDLPGKRRPAKRPLVRAGERLL